MRLALIDFRRISHRGAAGILELCDLGGGHDGWPRKSCAKAALGADNGRFRGWFHATEIFSEGYSTRITSTAWLSSWPPAVRSTPTIGEMSA